MKTFPLKSFIAAGVALAGLILCQHALVSQPSANVTPGAHVQRAFTYARLADGVETHGKNSPKPA